MVASVAALAISGYAVADALDRVPGIVTLAPPTPTQTAAPTSSVPMPKPEASTPSLTTPESAPAPTQAGLRKAVQAALSDPRLGESVGAVVYDGVSYDRLFEQGITTPRTPASLVKLLAATAIMGTMPGEDTFTTTARFDRNTRTLYLVGGGDVLLAKGAGDPAAVLGRAGLGALAKATAQALGESAANGVSLVLTSPLSGETRPPGWDDADYQYGSAIPVTSIGLAEDRPEPGLASTTDPGGRAQDVFRQALEKAGITVTKTSVGDLPASADEVATVESAPVGEVVSYALLTSDNAMVETLARAAAYRSGQTVRTSAEAAEFVRGKLAGLGIDVAGLKLKDVSGLSRGQQASVATIGQTLIGGEAGTYPGMRAIIRNLPVAGLSGTLKDRFKGPDGAGVAGLPRAKTGTLIGASNLAGWTITEDGRPLFFVVMADKVGGWEGTEPARAALDRFAATLTECGCR